MTHRPNTGPEIFLKCLLIFWIVGPLMAGFAEATKPRGKDLRVTEQAAGFLFLGALGAIAIPALMVAGTKKKPVPNEQPRFNSFKEVEAYLKSKERRDPL